MARGYVMALQEEHDVLDLLLLLPALFDPVHANTSDAGHIKQAVRIIFDDVQCISSKLPDDPPCEGRADPLDQAAPQIFFDPVDSRRKRLLKCLHEKLAPIPCIDLPGSAKVQYAPHMDIRH